MGSCLPLSPLLLIKLWCLFKGEYAAVCSFYDMTLQRVETQTVDLNGNNGSDKAFVALNIHHFKVGKLAEKQRFAAMIDSFNENIAFIADILLVSRRKSFPREQR